MVQLTWTQVANWRAARAFLGKRADATQMLAVASQVCGIQAQVMSAAALSLWARVQNLKPDDVEMALWQDRTLVKTWAMRGTLRLLVADDLPLYVAGYRKRRA